MNKLVFALIVLFALTSVASYALISEGSYLNVAMVSQIPDSAEPGQYVDVRFSIANEGSDAATGVIFELIPRYPFSLDGDSAAQYLGTIQGRQDGKDSVVIKYRLNVDEHAIEGVNELAVRYREEGEGKFGADAWVTLEPFNITIQTRDANLAIKDVAANPSEIAPGQTGQVSIVLENTADSYLRNIRTTLDLFTTYKLTSSVSEVTKPLSPIGSSNEKTVALLPPKKSVMVNFSLRADADADPAVYKIPVTLSYEDEQGRNFSRTSVISIIIGGSPDLIALLDSTEIYTSGSVGQVSIKIINKGATNVKFVYASLEEGDAYRIIESSHRYLGNIDSDDYENADFTLQVKGKTKEIVLPLDVTFKDANNQDYEKTFSIILPIYSASEAKSLGLIKGSSAVGILLVLIIVGGGVFWYLKRRKKRK